MRLFRNSNKTAILVVIIVACFSTSTHAECAKKTVQSQLNCLEVSYSSRFISGAFDEALSVAIEIRNLVVQNKEFAASDLGEAFIRLGGVERELANYKNSLPFLQQAISVLKSNSDTEKMLLVEAYSESALLHTIVADFVAAKASLAECTQCINEIVDPVLASQSEVYCDYAQGRFLVTTGDYADAIQLLKKTKNKHTTSKGQHIDKSLDIAYELGIAYTKLGDVKNATAEFQKIESKVYGEFHQNGLVSAKLFKAKGEIAMLRRQLDEARENFKKSLDLSSDIFQNNHPTIADSIENLAVVDVLGGNLETAVGQFREVLNIRQNSLGSSHPDAGVALVNIGDTLRRMGDMAGAKSYFIQGYSVIEKALGPHHTFTAGSASNLGSLLVQMGDIADAMPYFLKALEARQKLLDPNHPGIGHIYNNIGYALREFGDFKGAEEAFAKAIEIFGHLPPPGHPSDGISRLNRGAVLMSLGRLDEAGDEISNGIEILTRILGEQHPRVASGHRIMCRLQETSQRFEAAFASCKQAVDMHLRALGQSHPELAASYHQLGLVQLARGDLLAAQMSFENALTIYTDVFGKTHPSVSKSLLELAKTKAAKGETNFEQLGVLLEVEESLISDMMFASSNRLRSQYLQQFRSTTDFVLTLASVKYETTPALSKLAFEAILRRKGRALEANTTQFRFVRSVANSKELELLDHLMELREQRAYIVLNSPRQVDYDLRKKTLAKLKQDIEQAESRLSTASAAYRATPVSVVANDIQSRLPPRTALVEYFVFSPETFAGLNALKPEVDQLVAFVLTRKGGVDVKFLGPMAEIDKLTEELQFGLGLPTGEYQSTSRRLYALVIKDLLAKLSNVDSILVAPDGSLNLVPFSVLMDEDGRFLVERFSISNLTSGRDLLVWEQAIDPRSSPLLVGGVDFDDRPVLPASISVPVSDSRGIDINNMYFDPLPSTLNEIRQIGKVLISGQPLVSQIKSRLKSIFDAENGDDFITYLTGKNASEKAIKALKGPSILHLATHGFYLGSSGSESDSHAFSVTDPLQDPLLKSGLALSGFNIRDRATDANDGVLTAFEVMGLDLFGTQVVVLSACETGLGEVENGEGVYGLSRALILAGSQSQVLSLWKVPDTQTQQIMTSWYGQLIQNIGRADALRNLQLSAINGERLPTINKPLQIKSTDKNRTEQGQTQAHPYYWASFVVSGQSGPVDISKISVNQ